MEIINATPPPGRPEGIIVTEISECCWTIDVEQTAHCRLTLTNGGSRPATFMVGVVGLEKSWIAISPPQARLNPNEQSLITIAVTPPRQPTSQAGLHHLSIVVTSPDQPDQYSRQEATLVIKPYYEFAVGELSPKQQLLSKREQFGQLVIPLVNKGNDKTVFRLTGTDEAGVCHFEFQPPGEVASLAMQTELSLSPGETISVPVRITPPSRSLIGLKRAYFFTITTTMLAEQHKSRSVLGRLESPALIGPWLTTLITICLAALLAFVIQSSVVYFQAKSRLAETDQTGTSDQVSPDSVTGDFIVGKAAPSAESSEDDPAAKSEMTYEEIFQEIAPQYGLDWRLMAELAYQESRMNPLAVGKDSDMGLMQIIPSTWNEWAPKVGVTDPFDPYSNTLVAAAYLAYIRDYNRVRGHPEDYWLLIGYNWGPNNLRQLFENNGGFAEAPETQRRYALTILQARANASARWQENSP